MTTVLQAQQLWKVYDTGSVKVKALKGVDLEIEGMLDNGLKVALNGEFCSPDVEIPDASEIAFLPPVSGG